jgi:hypothetical protein
MPNFTLKIDGEEPIYGFLQPIEQQLYFVLHDIQMGSIRTCAPCPEVFNLGEPLDNNDSYKFFLTREWQDFLFALFVKVAYNKKRSQLTEEEFEYLAQKWTNLMASNKAFTNGNGSWTRRNYILNTNIGEPDMAYDKIRTSGGASITGKEEENILHQKILRVNAFDGRLPPPHIDSIDPYTDTRVFFCTNIEADGTVSRFPQLSGVGAPTPLLSHDVPLAIISENPIFYPMSKLKKLPLGSNKPSPYIF